MYKPNFSILLKHLTRCGKVDSNLSVVRECLTEINERLFRVSYICTIIITEIAV